MDMETPLNGRLNAKRQGGVIVWAFAAVASLLFLVAVVHIQSSATTKIQALEATADTQPLPTATVDQKVKIEVYGMAGCPYTRAFLEGPMSETLATVSDLLDVKFVTFGNSYYTTNKCGGTADAYPFASFYKGYDADVMACWDKMCGAAAAHPPKDCFEGTFVCEHGTSDGLVTTAWACAKALTEDSVSAYWPFITCSSKRVLAVTSADAFREMVTTCSKEAGLAPDLMLECALGAKGKDFLNAQARLTIPHDGVPFVLVEGKELDDTGCVSCGDGIMQKVCEALKTKGVENAICNGIFGQS